MMIAPKSMRLGGIVGQRAESNVAQWLSVAPFSNSSIFFRHRHRDLPAETYDEWFADRCGFAAEFPGKLLVSICECLKLSPNDERLLRAGGHIVARLTSLGSEDGYLGLFSKTERYVGHHGRREWDIWGAYHAIWGLLLWAEATNDHAASALCERCADALCQFVFDEKRDLCEAEELFANLSGGRVYCVLYERTRNERYLRMAEAFLGAMAHAGFNPLEGARQSRPFHRTQCGGVGARWELLHVIAMLEDMHRVTGEERYAEALCFYWKDILASDVHNTGGYSAGEGSCGNPYDLRAVELCCSIMWADLTCAYWRLTRDAAAADELERTLYNALLGSQHPTGRWWTYSSPMCGQKKPVEDIVVYQGFHFDGCHEMNCCAANSGRGIGHLSNWAAASNADGLYINYYGEGETTIRVADADVRLLQRTEYPKDGLIDIAIEPERPTEFALLLRIPRWAIASRAFLNGQDLACEAGRYLELRRLWQAGDQVRLELDMSPHFWVADERLDGLCSIYYGPLLLAFDHGKNPDFDWRRLHIERLGQSGERSFYQPSSAGLKLTLEGVHIDAGSLRPVRDITEAYPEPMIRVRADAGNGETVDLTDYMTAGMDNDWFTTWFDIPLVRSSASEIENRWNERCSL